MANWFVMETLPANLELPIFVYGTLKPDELAHNQIRDLVREKQRTSLAGFTLAVVDGIPYALPAGQESRVFGSIVLVDPSAYEKVASYEQVPYLYHWREVVTHAGAANMLVSSRQEITRSRHELREEWTVLDDTFMVHGLPWVSEKLHALELTAIEKGVGAQEGYLLIELQSIYMVLWTLFERILLFSDGVPGFGESIRKKLDKVRQDPDWLRAIENAAIQPVRVRPNGTPDRKFDHTTRFCFDDWVAMRNNIVHRGKAAIVEYKALKRACIDMSNVLVKFLEKSSPRLKEKWVLDKRNSHD